MTAVHVATKPAFEGFIGNTQDALLVFEACRRGIVPRTRNRLSDAERKAIVSGCVFVFSEEESKIKRWTDGRRWSPSRILNNFLIYREIPMAQDATVEEEVSPKAEEIDETMASSPQDNLTLPATANFDVNEPTEESKPADPFNKSIVGGHRGLALFKKGGLVKKTISVAGLHMISYYDPTDIANGRLQTPTSVPELANLDIDQCFLKAKYFRHPPQVTIDEDGLPRFAGLTDEEPMVRKPPSQQRKNISEATALANKAVYYGVPASIPVGSTVDESEGSTSPTLAPLVSPPRTASRSSSGLVRSRTSASSTSATTAASQSPNMTPRRTSTSSVRHEPYRVPSIRQSQTISGSVDLPPGFIKNSRPMTSEQPATIYSRRNPHQRSISLSEVYQSPFLPRAEGTQHHQSSPRQNVAYAQNMSEDVESEPRPFTSPAPFPSLSSASFQTFPSYENGTSQAEVQHYSGSVPLPALQYSGPVPLSFPQAEHPSWPYYQQQHFADHQNADYTRWPSTTYQQPLMQRTQAETASHPYPYQQLSYPAGVLHQPQPQHPRAPAFVYSEQASFQAGDTAASTAGPSDFEDPSPIQIPSAGPVPMHLSPSPNEMHGVERRTNGALGLNLPQTEYSPLMPSSASYSVLPSQQQMDYSQIPQYAQSSADLHSVAPTPTGWYTDPTVSPFLYKPRTASPPSYGYGEEEPAASQKPPKIALQTVHPQPYSFELKAPPVMQQAQRLVMTPHPPLSTANSAAQQ